MSRRIHTNECNGNSLVELIRQEYESHQVQEDAKFKYNDCTYVPPIY